MEPSLQSHFEKTSCQANYSKKEASPPWTEVLVEISRKKWLAQGDKNTRFFQNKMKSKRTNSLIYHLKDDLGRWVDSPTEIKGLLLNVLQDRFKSTFLPTHNIDLSFIQTIMSQQESASLLLPFSNEEIRVVFFDMNLHKAPGIDCYRAHLFQAYWSTIETDIRLAIKGFFHHEKLMPFLNHTILALLPKI